MKLSIGTKKFDVACRRLGITPNEAIFIDDRQDNVGAAVSLWMHGIVYKNNNQLGRDLISKLMVYN